MAYHLKLLQPLRDGVRRIAVGQLDKALIEPVGDAERAVWVHETRKALKRTRALLRLVRSGLDPATWGSENAALRDVARSLSPMRDRDILQQVMAGLAADGDAAMVDALGRSRDWLEARTEQAISSKSAANLLVDARARIADARERLARLSLEGDLADVLADGIAQGQRRGAKSLALVEAAPSTENLHELRKAVQTTWRHMVLVQAAWPDLMAARAAAARELAQLLGEVQDLAVLATAVKPPRGGGAGRRRDAELILAACQTGQQVRQAIALPSAARLYASQPRSCGREVAACWQAAVLMAVAAPRERKAPAGVPAQPIRHPRSKRRTG